MKVNQNNFIRGLIKREQDALDYVIDTYGWLIKSIVRKHLYSLKTLEEECVNDILLAVWYDIESFNEAKGNFQNWLAAVAKYKCIDYKRKYLKYLEYQNIDDINLVGEEYAEKAIIEKELSEEMEDLISNLKPEDKKVFLKYYVDQEDISVISKEMGIKTSVIYNKLSRGRTKLKSLFLKEVKGSKG